MNRNAWRRKNLYRRYRRGGSHSHRRNRRSRNLGNHTKQKPNTNPRDGENMATTTDTRSTSTTSPTGNKPPATSKATLGLTGLTINAMALIAPSAFLWLTFQEQSLYGAPLAGCAMWFGLLAALLLCFATAISYSELS